MRRLTSPTAMATVPIEKENAGSTPDGSLPPQDAGAGGLGDFLRRGRERRGLTLQQIASETKIPRRILEALEQDNITALPGGLYGRAEIRAFARTVHLDEDLALSKLERALAELVPRQPVPDTPPMHEPMLSRRRLLIAVVALVAAAMFGISDVQRHQSMDSEPTRPAVVLPGPVGTSHRSSLDEAAPPPARLSGASVTSESQGLLPTLGTGTGTSAAPVIPVAQVPRPRQATASGPVSSVTPGERVENEVPDLVEKLAPTSDVTTSTEQPRTKASAVSGTELTVIAEPPGARVTVDGIGWGVAPVTVRYLPPGNRLIRVSKDGYVTEERLVRLAEHARISIDVQLRSRP
jgi:cytoskeletal protein RodZ